MYISENDYSKEIRVAMRGGDGQVIIEHFTKDSLPPNVRLMARLTLEKGCSIGYHVHENETESFYFAAGQGTADDNGTIIKVQAGDTLVTKSGQGHSIRNDGDTPLVLIATIVLN